MAFFDETPGSSCAVVDRGLAKCWLTTLGRGEAMGNEGGEDEVLTD